jgi:hypothetical protein
MRKRETIKAAHDWTLVWQPMIDAVGLDFDEGKPLVWGEPIEPSTVSRYLEPLELDCRLHSDEAFARAHGYGAIVVPYTALTTLAVPLIWRPGDAPLFTSDDRNARLPSSPLSPERSDIEPPTRNGFAVRWDMEFSSPALIGDRLCRRKNILLSCTPKQTRVGRGAFMSWESEIINDREQSLARIRSTIYRYNVFEQEELHDETA